MSSDPRGDAPGLGTTTAAIALGRPVLDSHPEVRAAVHALEVALKGLTGEERARARRYIATVYLTPHRAD